MMANIAKILEAWWQIVYNTYAKSINVPQPIVTILEYGALATVGFAVGARIADEIAQRKFKKAGIELSEEHRGGIRFIFGGTTAIMTAAPYYLGALPSAAGFVVGSTILPLLLIHPPKARSKTAEQKTMPTGAATPLVKAKKEVHLSEDLLKEMETPSVPKPLHTNRAPQTGSKELPATAKKPSPPKHPPTPIPKIHAHHRKQAPVPANKDKDVPEKKDKEIAQPAPEEPRAGGKNRARKAGILSILSRILPHRAETRPSKSKEEKPAVLVEEIGSEEKTQKPIHKKLNIKIPGRHVKIEEIKVDFPKKREEKEEHKEKAPPTAEKHRNAEKPGPENDSIANKERTATKEAEEKVDPEVEEFRRVIKLLERKYILKQPEEQDVKEPEPKPAEQAEHATTEEIPKKKEPPQKIENTVPAPQESEEAPVITKLQVNESNVAQSAEASQKEPPTKEESKENGETHAKEVIESILARKAEAPDKKELTATAPENKPAARGIAPGKTEEQRPNSRDMERIVKRILKELEESAKKQILESSGKRFHSWREVRAAADAAKKIAKTAEPIIRQRIAETGVTDIDAKQMARQILAEIGGMVAAPEKKELPSVERRQETHDVAPKIERTESRHTERKRTNVMRQEDISKIAEEVYEQVVKAMNADSEAPTAKEQRHERRRHGQDKQQSADAKKSEEKSKKKKKKSDEDLLGLLGDENSGESDISDLLGSEGDEDLGDLNLGSSDDEDLGDLSELLK